MFDSEARNHGYDAMPGHDWRYARAEEFVDVALRLWDSWHDEAPQADRPGVYVKPETTHAIHNKGEHFRVDRRLTIPHTKQRNPVIFQARSYEKGRDKTVEGRVGREQEGPK